MQAYTGFAQVYDIFMDNVPYDEWTEYLTGLLREHGVMDGLVLELGCGTGKLTRRLAGKGYDMIGIDNSEEMLEIAREAQYDIDDMDNEYEKEENKESEDDIEQGNQKEADEDNEDIMQAENPKEADEDFKDVMEAVYQEKIDIDSVEYSDYDYFEPYASSAVMKGNQILYLQQDMRDFELYGTVAAVISICDSMNYITSEEDLLKVFRLVNNYLDPGGLFIFDMNTEYKYKEILSNNTIAENREDCSFIWENYYHEETMLNEYDVTIFVKLKEDEDNIPTELFERFQETHYQKAYKIDTIKRLLEEAGMEFIAVYDAFTHSTPAEKSERVYFLAKEKHQENKTYI